jgi:hypothetical protein
MYCATYNIEKSMFVVRIARCAFQGKIDDRIFLNWKAHPQKLTEE